MPSPIAVRTARGNIVDGPVGLGHRRLAIIDLSPLGRQPMTTPDGRYTLVFNGEIFNFQELRAQLTGRGHAFVSRTDSEVVLHAFAEWGLGVLRRLNGMFAFAIWDRDKRTLTVARDRFGVKPIYWAEVGDCFLFGSEIKAIFAYGTLQPSLDVEGLAEYLTFQNFFTSRTLFCKARLLPQGCYLQVRPGSEPPKPVQYWDFRFEEPDHARNDADYLEELDHLFQQAVSRQLISDVEIGSYLSGGMDSGSITALAGRQLPWIRTFTVGFDLSSASGVEMGFDERSAAEHMSYLFKTEHYEMVLKAGDMERILPKLAWHLEEPRVGQCYPNFYASRLASKFVKVVLSGAGGDELFAGYPWRYFRAVVNEDFDDYVEKYFAFWQRLLPESDRAARARADRFGEFRISTRVKSSAGSSRSMRRRSRGRRITSITPSISRQKPSSTACWWWRTSCRWRTASRPGCPSSTTTWSISPCAFRPIPSSAT